MLVVVRFLVFVFAFAAETAGTISEELDAVAGWKRGAVVVVCRLEGKNVIGGGGVNFNVSWR